jgi:hypothetical protein
VPFAQCGATIVAAEETLSFNSAAFSIPQFASEGGIGIA